MSEFIPANGQRTECVITWHLRSFEFLMRQLQLHNIHIQCNIRSTAVVCSVQSADSHNLQIGCAIWQFLLQGTPNYQVYR